MIATQILSFFCHLDPVFSIALPHVAAVTMTLHRPRANTIFKNNQAEFECTITGEDDEIVSETTITWQVDGQNVSSSRNGTTKNEGNLYSKTSTLIRRDWAAVNKVRCCALKEDMTPIIQDLSLHKGGMLPSDGRK